MKKNLLIALVLGAFAASSFAQGTVTFNSGGNIKYTSDGTTITKVPAGTPGMVPVYGQINIAIYSASGGTVLGSTNSAYGLAPDLSSNSVWLIASPVITTITPVAGTVGSQTITMNALSGAAGASEALEIVAWTGNFASFSAALQAGTGLVGWTGQTLSGGAFGWTQLTGSALTPAALTAGAAGYNGGVTVITPVPEPATIVLGGLGAATLLLFRRRK